MRNRLHQIGSAWLVAILIALCGCSLPRIRVLKDPLTPEEHLNLGLAYERSGELDNAIREYGLAARKRPIGHLYLGNAYFQRRDFERAERHYKRALKEIPENADVYNNLAWLYYTRDQNLEEAESYALRAMELNPSKVHIYRDTLEKIREKRHR